MAVDNAPVLCLALPDLLFRTLPVLDVGVAAEPVDDVAGLIELRNHSHQEPAILTVEAAKADFPFLPNGVTRE